MTTTTKIAAGGPDSFMTVHHLTVTGSQTEIGRALAVEAGLRYGWAPASADPTLERARRGWFQHCWPQHAARMTGAAEAAGVDPEEGAVHLDGLTGVPEGSGCSVTWAPPSITEEGRGLIGRNYDFFTVGAQQLFAMVGGPPGPPHEPPMASRPYVVTSLPDDGPASTFITMNELDSCMEGINEHGLAVALLIADAEAVELPVEAGPQVGLNPTQLPRFVLDTCTTVDEAKQALLGAKQYDVGVPLHYLIADASGQAFVWERGHGGVEHILDAGEGPMCVTNHLLHRHPDPQDLPADNDETMLTYQRAATLAKRTTGATMSGSKVREVLDEVRFSSVNAGAYPLRTLWRSVLDVNDRTMATHFYLGDAPSGELTYSPELTFSADPAR